MLSTNTHLYLLLIGEENTVGRFHVGVCRFQGRLSSNQRGQRRRLWKATNAGEHLPYSFPANCSTTSSKLTTTLLLLVVVVVIVVVATTTITVARGAM